MEGINKWECRMYYLLLILIVVIIFQEVGR